MNTSFGTDLAPSAGDQWLSVAAEITARGLWCVIEEPRDEAVEEWEPRLIICSKNLERIAESVVEFVKGRARIAGYTRDRLVRVDSVPTAICCAA